MLLHIGSKDIGLQLFKHCLSFFLLTGTILPFFQSDGNILFVRQSLNMNSDISCGVRIRFFLR